MTLHRLTHKCVPMAKPGVGEVWLCRRRLRRAWHMHVRPEGDTCWTRLPGAYSDLLFHAHTAGELQAAVDEALFQILTDPGRTR